MDSDTLSPNDAVDLIGNEEHEKRARMLEAALAQLCTNNGGSVSIPMLPIPVEFIGDFMLECRCYQGAYEFRLRKR